MKKSLLVLLSVLVITSCSVQKRRYQKGFYVSRPHQKETSIHPAPAPSKQNKHTESNIEEVHTGDKILDASVSGPVRVKPINKHAPPDSCDVLVFQDGSEVRVKVTEVNPNDIKYKRCDNLTGPDYVTRKSNLFLIKFANGTRELIKSDPAPSESMPTYTPREYKKKPKVNHPRAGISLALGLASIILPIILYGFATVIVPPWVIIPLVGLAIAAIVVSGGTLRQIREQEDVYKGRGMAIPGLVMGIVMTSIYFIIALAVLAVLFI